ncbi:hypothetical protein EDD35_6802 [Amycolatopsis thermoflava]|uniref:Uncharacterized protein n=1 Tax=Amycolatopsis thermoflava TaxID=84480 RepID=A0A3N2H621_9PSEU|nr:hypothetical protein EDD35_6802 [Amycolatopsis thermoflava]
MRVFPTPPLAEGAALCRPGSQKLASYARPSDTVTVSELCRLCRALAHRAWCQEHQVKLRARSGALSGITALTATTTARRAQGANGKRWAPGGSGKSPEVEPMAQQRRVMDELPSIRLDNWLTFRG